MRSRIRQAAAIAASLAFALAFTACAIEKPEPTPTGETTSSATPTPTPTPDPTFDPAGGAAANHAFFDFTNRDVLAADPAAGGRSFIDALAAAGFDKSRMEVTPDETAVDLKADSIQFSVRFDDGCLVGQSGEGTGYVSQERAALATGRCLVGVTRPIDW